MLRRTKIFEHSDADYDDAATFVASPPTRLPRGRRGREGGKGGEDTRSIANLYGPAFG